VTSCHYYIITFFVLTLLACTYYVWWCVWNRVQQLFEYGIPFFLFLKNRKLIRQRIFLNIKIRTQSENVCPYIHEIYMGVCVFVCRFFTVFIPYDRMGGHRPYPSVLIWLIANFDPSQTHWSHTIYHLAVLAHVVLARIIHSVYRRLRRVLYITRLNFESFEPNYTNLVLVAVHIRVEVIIVELL